MTYSQKMTFSLAASRSSGYFENLNKLEGNIIIFSGRQQELRWPLVVSRSSDRIYAQVNLSHYICYWTVENLVVKVVFITNGYYGALSTNIYICVCVNSYMVGVFFRILTSQGIKSNTVSFMHATCRIVWRNMINNRMLSA